jgi:hypothetical protein
MLAELVLAATLPAGAVVIETQVLARSIHTGRSLVLWMLSPQASDCVAEDDYAFSCPGTTRGCYFHGPTRVSLVDQDAERVIDTIAITDPFTGEDAFDVPRKLYGDTPYHVGQAYRPRILRLQDHNRDGVKAEFVMFDAESCADLFTGLIGYSAKQDRLLWYNVRVSGWEGLTETNWPETLFAVRPSRDGLWRYRLAWPGEEPSRRCEVRYRPDLEDFEAVCLAEK